ncbi:MAG: carbohydrate porin [Proteobacteria bacterium]|nr:carbohydrate porin [Pseudomonadota bacterium]
MVRHRRPHRSPCRRACRDGQQRCRRRRQPDPVAPLALGLALRDVSASRAPVRRLGRRPHQPREARHRCAAQLHLGDRRQCQRRRQTGSRLCRPARARNRHRLAEARRHHGLRHAFRGGEPRRQQREPGLRRQSPARPGDLRRRRQCRLPPRVSLRRGDAVGTDYAASPLNCDFMNNGLCGNPKELPGGNNGFSAWPDATFGGRVRVRPTPDTYLQVGLFGVDPHLYQNPQDRSGWNINASQYNGYEVPVEAAWEPSFGPDHLIGHYKLGFGYNSAPYAQFLGGAPGESGPEKRDRWQFWALADQMLIRQGKGDQAGLIGLAGYIHSNPTTIIYQNELYAGLIDQGFWHARPDDAVGLLFIYQTVSDQLTSAERMDQEFGLPYGSSATGVVATGVQTNEEVLEANYDIHVYRGVNLMPDFQYVMHPNAQTDIPNAVVLGLKAHVEF